MRCYAALSKQSARDENMLQVYAEAQLEAERHVPLMMELWYIGTMTRNSYMKHTGTRSSRSRLAHKQQSGICTLGKLTRIGARPPSVQRAQTN